MNLNKSTIKPLLSSTLAVFLLLCLASQTNAFDIQQARDAVETSQAESSPQQSTPELSSGNESNEAPSIQTQTFDVLSPKAWMDRLANTVAEITFEASFVVSAPKRETMPYIWRHAILDSGDVAEQLSLLNGPGFEQIRINNKVSIFEPGFTPVSIRSNAIDGPIPDAFIHKPELLYDSYDVLLMGRNRVSGRMAQKIRIISKDKSRYQYHLWLDEQTGLLLKQNMYDLEGVLLEQIQVTRLTVSDQVKQNFANIQTQQLPPVATTPKTREQQLPWTLDSMPIGMQIVAQNLRRIPITNQLAEYMMISDGLVDVSIYVTEATDVAQEDISGSTDATSIVSISDGRIQVTVIGEIPLATANTLANSIVLRTDKLGNL